jgi:molybdenum cofactor cytidylyltransferase
MRNIGAVVLAAGGSSRLGQPKQLLVFQGETLVGRAVRAATEAGCTPVIVIVGETGDAIRAELDTQIMVVENPEWRKGLGTSIRLGLEQLGESADAVVLLACDQPHVDASIIGKLIAAREKTGGSIAACRYANTLGVPALFDRSCFKELLTLPDNCGAKSIIEARQAETIPITFEEGAVDVDTPEDFERLDANRD